MQISEKLKQFTMGAVLSVALTFLVVHPGMFTSTAHAHSDPQTGQGNDLPIHKYIGSRFNYATYFSASCAGRHDHRTLYVVEDLFTKMRRNNEHGYREIHVDDGVIQVGECVSMCLTYQDKYLKCLALQMGLSDAAVSAGIASLATVGWSTPVSVIAAAAGLVAWFSSWLVGLRCNKNKPDPGQCPFVEYAL
ncbi:MAG: hypothetical protein F4Z14_06615 [Gammaproteobacteria bacterium]|nr:hypothetical protein [Gammaproteobacteria bacterium]